MAHRSSSLLDDGNGANAIITVPTGAAVDDIAVAGIYKENAASITTVPSGFNLKAQLDTSPTARGSLWVYWKRLIAADSGSYTWSWTGSTWRGAVCGLWSGRVTTGDPFDGFGTAQSTTGVTVLNVEAIPAAADGDAVGMWTNFNGGATWTPPANYTERQDSNVLTLDTRDAVAVGSTGSISATSTITDFMKAFLGVLAAAGTGTAMNLGNAVGTGAAQALSTSKIIDLGAATGSGAAQALSAAKAVTLDPATGTGSPQAMTFSKFLELVAATGTGAPAAIGADKALALGTAAGTGEAQALTPGKALGLQEATGSGAAQAMSFGAAGSLDLGTATGTGTPQAMTFSKDLALGTATGTGTPQPLASAKALALGTAVGVGAPQALALGKALALGTAAGSGAAQQLASSKLLVLAAATGTGQAQQMTLGGAFVAPTEWTISSPPDPDVAARDQAYSALTRRTPYTAITRESV